MDFIYPFFISFLLVFLSELGDKTQLLVLSFSAKTKTVFILLGVALGSLFSHGIAILFGSVLGSIQNESFKIIIEFITYLTFLFFGVVTILKKEKEEGEKQGKVSSIAKRGMAYVFIIAFSIAIGEFGDKTFLASIGLGISYPTYKLSLILGAVLGMIASDSIAIVLGKFLSKKISPKAIKNLSGAIFLLFGFIGMFHLLGDFVF